MIKYEISVEIINNIKDIIEQKQNCKLQLNKTFNTYWLIDKNNEFRISSIGKYQIVISRVEFQNKRLGTMTSIINLLKKYCAKEHILQICIQSVETKEMMNWCIKNNFIPNENAIIKINDLILGDYLFNIV